ncbi:hypothetical protein [Bythopirellula polymerisocia]|uniref:Uncharacterized protein n=1 Tax=Bythopirellula polymerisocia TaxID=2528003 RepID=A0A5C6CDB1_9BACT|nr:hypothetical protein [Bythopirellula polymerisocia]TWU20809.1 hypothetical protein Pla144_48620 [Bythopirellula polymerisocia]
MNELPLVMLSPRLREDATISSSAKLTGYLKPNEEATQLRKRLLQMILNNEQNRRTPPPASNI